MKQRIDQILGWVLVICLSLTVVNVVWQVFSRYILGTPSTFTDELSTYLLIWVGLLGAAFVTGKGTHLAIDILPNKLEGVSKKALDWVITCLVVLFALCVMVLGRAFAFNFFKTSICVYSRPNIPLAPLKGGNNYWDSPAG